MNASQKWQQLYPKPRPEKVEPSENRNGFRPVRRRAVDGRGGCCGYYPTGGRQTQIRPVEGSRFEPSFIGTNCCVNFDTGIVFTPPSAILTEMTVTNRPGNDFFEAMPESFFWAKYRADSKATNTLARWIEDSNVDAVALGTYGLVLFCPVHSSMKIDETGAGVIGKAKFLPRGSCGKYISRKK